MERVNFLIMVPEYLHSIIFYFELTRYNELSFLQQEKTNDCDIVTTILTD